MSDTADTRLRKATRLTEAAGRQSKLWVSLDRLDRFGVGRFHDTDVLSVGLWLPALTERRLAYLARGLPQPHRPVNLWCEPPV
jgi:hypothetical protein